MDGSVKHHQLELLEILNAYDDMPEDVEAGLLAAIKWLARREPADVTRFATPLDFRLDHIPNVRVPFT